MYETAVVTENYLEKFIADLNLTINHPIPETILLSVPPDQLIVGNASAEEQSKVARKITEFPEALTTFFKANGVRLYVAAEGTRLTRRENHAGQMGGYQSRR
ncbi:MAG: hypothetical protein ACYS0I_15275 [Planctomycetota bacterium]